MHMRFSELKKKIDLLYNGRSKRAVRFRYGLIVFDVATIIFFMATVALPLSTPLLIADILLALFILADFGARLWIAPRRWKMLIQVYTIADIIVILSLFLAPLLSGNYAFLRVLRTLRLLHSFHVLRDLRRENTFFRRHESVLIGSVNLTVFVFVTTALVFALQHQTNPLINSYLDALYFTMSTLTTTGFGDVTLPGFEGKLLSVFIMLIGVVLFLRLATAIFRPSKITYTCPECGLNRHEPDAIHCKHCGTPIKIETEGG